MFILKSVEICQKTLLFLSSFSSFSCALNHMEGIWLWFTIYDPCFIDYYTYHLFDLILLSTVLWWSAFTSACHMHIALTVILPSDSKSVCEAVAKCCIGLAIAFTTNPRCQTIVLHMWFLDISLGETKREGPRGTENTTACQHLSLSPCMSCIVSFTFNQCYCLNELVY